MQLVFTFTHNPETKETSFVGNIEPQVALAILQQIVIAEAVRKVTEEAKKVKES